MLFYPKDFGRVLYALWEQHVIDTFLWFSIQLRFKKNKRLPNMDYSRKYQKIRSREMQKMKYAPRNKKRVFLPVSRNEEKKKV